MPTQVTVTGTFDSAPGVPAQGYVTWQLSDDLSDTNGNLICTSAPLKFPLVNGVMTAVVWANDDPTVQPIGTFWTVSVYVVNGQYGGPAPLATLVSQNKYVLAHTSPNVNLASLPVAQPSTPMQSVVTSVTAGANITVSGGDGSGHGALTIAGAAGGGGGLPAPNLTHGFEPGFGVSSGQNFVMASGTTSTTIKWDTAYTLEMAGAGSTTLTDDTYFHWDPATPAQFTVKQSGWYWCNYSIDIGILSVGLPSPLEWGIQPVFGLVNGDETVMLNTKLTLFTRHSFLGWITGPQTGSLTVALIATQTNSFNYNISSGGGMTSYMMLIPLF